MPDTKDTWFFPKLGGGEERGLNDAGVEQFKKSASLGRETIQNIGDARSVKSLSAGAPAIAEFELLHIPCEVLPGREEMLAIFGACRLHIKDRFEKPADQKANGLPLIDRAIVLLKGNTVPTLRIRDLNTTGLRGTDDPKDRNSPYWRLIRGQGFSSREGVGGGTYGIGQRAPFAFSDLRTIFYYSRLDGGAETFIGKAILCSFPHPDDNELTQNIGWFCRLPQGSQSWLSIREASSIPDYFRRQDPAAIGTDLYVTAYGNAESGQWRKELRRSVVRNFFGAIHAGVLEVRIKDGSSLETISSGTIVDIAKQEAQL